MSPSIWTRCAASSKPRRLKLKANRVVESQYVISTRKLVTTDDEQQLLESLIDKVKPPIPAGMDHLHPLLFTPFRHPPLRWGSRFGTRAERGIWYGAITLPTAFAEVAYYRLVFLEGTKADLAPVTVELSAFTASVDAKRGVDLSRPPFAAYEARFCSKKSYAESQPLGSDMRAAGIEAFTFRSARDPGRGLNVALLTPCFARPRPTLPRTYVCTASRDIVDIARKDLLSRAREAYSFRRDVFEVGGKLPIPS
ncbi:MAG: RES family NAD+ phosphorylase [Polyangiaceae bacterium]|jgi:hypothetical protein